MQAGDTTIHLADKDDLPVSQQLIFSLKSAEPFPRTGKLEIANADETLHTTLSVASGNLILQNPHTLLVTLDPLSAFGTSAFGPLRLRPVMPDGTTGDWLPLVTLVRLPTFKDLHCPADATQPCTVSGSSLYLVDSIATDSAFTTPTTVPEGFIGNTLSLPHPAKTGFYPQTPRRSHCCQLRNPPHPSPTNRRQPLIGFVFSPHISHKTIVILSGAKNPRILLLLLPSSCHPSSQAEDLRFAVAVVCFCCAVVVVFPLSPHISHKTIVILSGAKNPRILLLLLPSSCHPSPQAEDLLLQLQSPLRSSLPPQSRLFNTPPTWSSRI